MTISDYRKKYRLTNILFKTIYRNKSCFWRAEYLQRKGIFHHIGEKVFWGGMMPSDPYLISIGNNVIIAAGVEFITHDIFYHMFNNNNAYSNMAKFYPYFDKICIEDNVCIGGFSRIMPGITIHSNSIIAGGSVVTKDVPHGCIVGGNPAKIIGSTNELVNKRLTSMANFTIADDMETVIKYFWNDGKSDSQ